MAGIKDLGDGRFRELVVIMKTLKQYIYEHRPGRTITEADNNYLFTNCEYASTHFDEEYGRC